MVDHGNSEGEKRSYEDRLAEDYQAFQEGTASQAVFGQVIGALALRGVVYTTDVVHAYGVLKKPIDPVKLLNDPAYKAEIERALKLVQRHEGKKQLKEEGGTSKYKTSFNNTTKAVEQTNAYHKQHAALTDTHLSSYLNSAKSIYGIQPEDNAKLLAQAKVFMKDHPGITAQEAIRIESEKLVRSKNKNRVKDLEKQIKKEFKNQKLNETQLHEEVNKRLGLDTKQQTFETQTAYTKLNETTQTKNLQQTHLKKVAGILGVDLNAKQEKPAPVQTQQVSSTPPVSVPESAQPRPPISKRSTITGMAAPPKLTLKQQVMSTAAGLATAATLQTGVLPKVVEQSPQPTKTVTSVDPSLQMPSYAPQQAAPSHSRSLQSAPASFIRDRVQSKFSFSSLFKSLFRKSGGATSALGSVGKSLLSGGLKMGLSSLGKMGLKQALASVVPGVGNIAMLALDKVNDLIKRFTGVDVEGLLIKGAVVVVVCVIALLFVLPFFLSSGEDFSFLIGQDSLSVPVAPNTTTWQRFETEYLGSVKNNDTSIHTWNVFKNTFLSAAEKRLSEK